MLLFVFTWLGVAWCVCVCPGSFILPIHLSSCDSSDNQLIKQLLQFKPQLNSPVTNVLYRSAAPLSAARTSSCPNLPAPSTASARPDEALLYARPTTPSSFITPSNSSHQVCNKLLSKCFQFPEFHLLQSSKIYLYSTFRKQPQLTKVLYMPGQIMQLTP